MLSRSERLPWKRSPDEIRYYYLRYSIVLKKTNLA